MTDDEIKHAPRCIDVRKRGMPKLNVGKRQLAQKRIAIGDLALRRINAKKSRRWELLGHRQQIPTRSASQFQYTTLLDGTGRHAQ